MNKWSVVKNGLLGCRAGKVFQSGLAVACAVLLAISPLGMTDVMAAETYETTYKVMIYSGDKGTFHGTACVSGAGEAVLQSPDTIVVSGLHYGETINIRVSSTNGTIDLKPEDGGKYQPTGTRRSGRDNSEAFDQENAASPSRTHIVTEDRSFVVTYGVPGNMIPYTVSYVQAGSSTPVPGSETQTFYGVAGEKPVVSAPHFDGYTPVYRAITGTLKKGQENAWVFEYTRNVQPTSAPTTPAPTAAPTVAPQSPSQPVRTTTESGADQTGENEDTEVGEGGDDGTANGDTAPEDVTEGTVPEGGGEPIDDEETPAGIRDLDDEEVPAGNIGLDEGGEESEEAGATSAEAKRLPVFASIGAAAAILLGTFAAFSIKKKKFLFKK